MPRLVSPHTRYKITYLAYLRELGRDRKIVHLPNKQFREIARRSFPAFVQFLKDNEQGKRLPTSWVPQSTYWLVLNTTVIGEIRIRHRLTPFLRRFGGHIGYTIRPSKRRRGYGTLILKKALPKTKALGISKALLTVDEDNIGSIRIIEKNGGKYQNTVVQGKGEPRKKRYWILIR